VERFSTPTSPAIPCASAHDAELSFRALVQNIDHVSGFQAGVHTLKSRATAADVAQTCGLSERTGKTVHAPRFVREDQRTHGTGGDDPYDALEDFLKGSEDRRRALASKQR